MDELSRFARKRRIGYCSSHRIHEEVLDKAVWDYTKRLREQYAAELKKVTQLQKTVGIEETSSRCPLFDFAERNFEIGAEVDALVMERLNGDGGSSAHEIGT